MDWWLQFVLTVVILCVHLGGLVHGDWVKDESSVTTDRGHYPPMYCTYKRLLLRGDTGTFIYRSHQDLYKQCTFGADVWMFDKDPNLNMENCTESFDKGYIFTIFYFYGSNYFHLHYDMLIPLYQAMVREDNGGKSVVYMPSVESSRLQKLNWDTPAFDDEQAYWVQTVKALVGTNSYRPMNKSLRKEAYSICFKEARFGTPQVKFDDSELIKGYVNFMKDRLEIQEQDMDKPLVGLITRSNRRRILNEKEVVEAVRPVADMELVKFEGMSFKQQVQAVQKYAVLMGINGAGLMNAIYLPTDSVAVQLVPYEAHLNNNEFGTLLKSRGSYLEWHNTHQELTVPMPGDSYNNRPDTNLHLQEMIDLVKEALMIYEKNIQRNTGKSEL